MQKTKRRVPSTAPVRRTMAANASSSVDAHMAALEAAKRDAKLGEKRVKSFKAASKAFDARQVNASVVRWWGETQSRLSQEARAAESEATAALEALDESLFSADKGGEGKHASPSAQDSRALRESRVELRAIRKEMQQMQGVRHEARRDFRERLGLARKAIERCRRGGADAAEATALQMHRLRQFVASLAPPAADLKAASSATNVMEAVAEKDADVPVTDAGLRLVGMVVARHALAAQEATAAEGSQAVEAATLEVLAKGEAADRTIAAARAEAAAARSLLEAAKREAEVDDDETEMAVHAAKAGIPLANGAALQLLCPGAVAGSLLRVVRAAEAASSNATTVESVRAEAMKALTAVSLRLGEQLEALEAAIRHEEARSEVAEAMAEAARERHAHLDVLHAQRAERKAQAAREAAAAADAARREEERRQVHERARAAEVAAKAAEFRSAKEAKEQAARREKEAEEQRKRDEFLAAAPEREERLAYRRQAYETRRENEQQAREAKELEARRKEEAVAAFLRQVEESMGVTRDADRLVGNTNASAARAEETEAQQRAARVAAKHARGQPVAGFSDQQLHNDPRTRIAAALAAAGIDRTDYARSMISAMGRVSAAARMSEANPFAVK